MDANTILAMARSTVSGSLLNDDTKRADVIAALVVPGDFGDHEPIADDMISVVSVEDKEIDISYPILADKPISAEGFDLNASCYINVGDLPPNEAQVFVDDIINKMKSSVSKQ